MRIWRRTCNFPSGKKETDGGLAPENAILTEIPIEKNDQSSEPILSHVLPWRSICRVRNQLLYRLNARMDRRGRLDRHPDGRICREHVWYLQPNQNRIISLISLQMEQSQPMKGTLTYFCCWDWGDCEPYRDLRDCASDRFAGQRALAVEHDLSCWNDWNEMKEGERPRASPV